MNQKRILIVDDSFDMLEVLQRQLSSLKYPTFQAYAVSDAVDILENSDVDLLITDLQMPGVGGMELVKYSAQKFPSIPILVITGYPSVDGAVEAMKSGALEYLVKPFTAKELKDAVEKVLVQRYGTQIAPERNENQQPASDFFGILGQSESFKDLVDLIQRVNNNRVTTLITGESGTGKELVARAIHYSGQYSKSPFIVVNCGAIPENLLESELFGHIKGAFTDAKETRTGFFQAADGGTIFLDEIGNASSAVQTKLLRVIQEKEVLRVGENKPQKIDVRVIAATNSDLHQMSKQQTFREDLYYRLNVISINVPPLRDRKEDIGLIAHHFVDKYAHEFGKSNEPLNEKVCALLENHSWPGNIRELENIIQRALVLSDTVIKESHLPEYIRNSSQQVNVQSQLRTLQEVEYQHILRVLEFVDNNKTEAARILGINRKTLRQKLLQKDDTK